MVDDQSVAAASGIGRRQFVRVGVASLISSVVGYVVLVVTSRTLSPADNATFLAFWSLLFAWFGILGGLSSEMTRATHDSDAAPPVPGAPHMLVVGLGIGLSLSIAVAATSVLWSPLIFGTGHAILVVPLGVAVLLFSGHASVVGVLGGRGQWGTFARLVTIDSLVRLVFIAAVALFVAEVAGFAAAACVSPFTWLVGLAFSRNLRRAIGARADSLLPQFLRRIGHAMAGAGSAAVLVVGFPILLRLTSGDAVYLASAPLILAISLTRAPLLIPLNAYQGVAIAHFVRNRESGLLAMWPITRIVLGVGVLGAVLAWFIGTWIMTFVFGPHYEVAGWVLGLLTFDAAGLAILTLTGSLCLAFGRHRAFSGGWLAATVLSVLVLLLPFSIEIRSVVGLFAGPALGIGLHLVAIRGAVIGARGVSIA